MCGLSSLPTGSGLNTVLLSPTTELPRTGQKGVCNAKRDALAAPSAPSRASSAQLPILLPDDPVAPGPNPRAPSVFPPLQAFGFSPSLCHVALSTNLTAPHSPLHPALRFSSKPSPAEGSSV